MEKNVVVRCLVLSLWLLGFGAAAVRAGDEASVPRLEAALPEQATPFAIDLDSALRLAQDENPDIAIARVAIMEARARATLANLLLAPNLNGGTNYHGHVGDLQRSSGRIISLSEQSLYFGGGARTLAAESVAIPAVNISSPLADALFEPLAARRHVIVTRFDARAVANSTLRDVAVLYLELVRAKAVVEALRLSLSQSGEVVRTARNYAEAGKGREADADRAAADWSLLGAELQGAEGELLAASARLAERLNLDPSLPLLPVDESVAPFTLIDDQVPIDALLLAAITYRPELAARAAAIGEAEARYKEERWRPALPTLWLGFSGGTFGGGSNLVPPLVGNFGGRYDFDARAYWTLLNLGGGNLALQKRRRAELGQANAAQALTINRVRREVAEAQAESLANRTQLERRKREVEAAERGFAEDYARSRLGLGRPIEVLNNLSLLIVARVNFIRAVVRYNQAQVRLFVALGSPPPLRHPEQTEFRPPPSLTVPLHSSIREFGP